MNKTFVSSLHRAPLLAACVVLAAACSDEPETPEPAAEAEAPSMIQRDAPEPERTARETPRENARAQAADEDFRVIPEVSGQLEQDGMGLETIIDASSKSAYAQSLRWIAEDVSAEQMKSLERSIRFLHMYDRSILGSEERLLDKIDGMTGAEILEEARRINESRGYGANRQDEG